jgi:hypothetical protein
MASTFSWRCRPARVAAINKLIIFKFKGGSTRATILHFARGAAAALLAVLAGAGALGAAVTPTLTQVNSTIQCGNVLPNASSTGTLTFTPGNVPYGLRSATTCTLEGSTTVLLGSFTLAGTAGDSFKVNTGTITNPKNGTHSVTVSSVTYSLSTGTFPEASTLYIGLVLSVPKSSSLPGGLYSGNVSITVTDTTANKTSSSSKFNINVTSSAASTGISLTKTQDLSFGSIVHTGSSAGTVSIAANGTRTASSGIFVAAGEPGAAGTFTVQGATSCVYSIAFTATPITLTGPGGATLSVALTSSPSGQGTLSSASPGTQTLYVLGTLSVGASQAAGTYAGTYTLTVSY